MFSLDKFLELLGSNVFNLLVAITALKDVYAIASLPLSL